MSKQRALELCGDAISWAHPNRFDPSCAELRNSVESLCAAIRELANDIENIPLPPGVTRVPESERFTAYEKSITPDLRTEIRSLIILAYQNQIEADILTNRIMIWINPLLNKTSDQHIDYREGFDNCCKVRDSLVQRVIELEEQLARIRCQELLKSAPISPP